VERGQQVPAILAAGSPGGVLVADNVVDFREILRPMLDRALSDERVDAVVVPFLTGQLVCRRL